MAGFIDPVELHPGADPRKAGHELKRMANQLSSMTSSGHFNRDRSAYLAESDSIEQQLHNDIAEPVWLEWQDPVHSLAKQQLDRPLRAELIDQGFGPFDR